MASKSLSAKVVSKVHLDNPSREGHSMCGRQVILMGTDKPAKTTCKTCRKLYEANPKAYSAAKRKKTLAAKK